MIVPRPDTEVSSHYDSVDSLRGVSIFVVLILHFHLTYRLTENFLGDVLHHPVLVRLVRNGNYGVVMFFVISGFLITSRTLLRSGSLDQIKVRDFYKFRIGRILPNIFLMTSLVVIFGLLGIQIFQNKATGPSLGITIASIFTFTHNLLMQSYGYFNYCLNILWSLSVEEVFYLAFPFVCLLSKRKWMPILIWIAFIFIAPIYRFHHRNDEDDIYGLYHYLACFDGIAMGCLVAYLRKSITIPTWFQKLNPLFPLGMTLVYFYDGIWENVVWGISAMVLLTGMFLLSLSPAPKESPGVKKAFAPLRWLGKHSYELYLFHIIVLAFMKTAVSRDEVNSIGKLTWFLVFMSASLILSALVSRFYSEPLNRKIRNLFA